MSKTHWLKNPNKNYLGNWDLPENEDLILTISSAKWEIVKNPVNNKESEKRVVRFKEEGIKPLICNETNAKNILLSIGVEYMEDSSGKTIALYKADYFDRKAKEHIKVVRIRVDKVKPKKIILSIKSGKLFDNILTALRNGKTINEIKEKIAFSIEIEKELLKQKNETV